ncbi:MAG: DUF4291 domain-containing protein [Myxococcales bacterium]|nr:DUF4291 domain-containing protein [Myxococcales bacterium]
MGLLTELSSFTELCARLPAAGRHVVAAYDAETVTVYQAYRPAIAEFAVAHGVFGGEFSFSRMSWIKPGFLWMMYRSGWATKEGQERVLAVRLTRAGFDRILSEAVESSFHSETYGTRENWERRLRESDVRLQWDPDHDPHGRPLERRAIQLGLRGETLACYGRDWVRGIEDVTPFVHAQHELLLRDGVDALRLPVERPYPFGDPEVAERLRLTRANG